jgi:hypothetical protein
MRTSTSPDPGRAQDRVPSAGVPELQSVLEAGQQALSVDGDLQASRACFDRAYQLAESVGDVEAMAEAAIGLAGLWVSENRTVVGAALLRTRLQDALSLVDPRSSLALRIRARLASEADYLAGQHDRIDSVLAEVRSTADPLALAEALSLAHHCLLGPDHAAARRELAADLIGVSFRTGRRSDRLMGLMWQTVDCFTEGDQHGPRVLGELRDQLTERDHPAVSFIVSALDVLLAIRSGRFDDAERLVAVCAGQGSAAGDIDGEWWPGAQLVTIRWYQGRLGELLPALRDQVHSSAVSRVDYSVIAALAVAAALAGDQPEATSSLAMLQGGDLSRLPRSSSWLVTMNGVIEAAYLVADSDSAALAYDLLHPYQDLPMVGGLGVTCFGSAHQALGVAALTTGHADLAIDHLRAAIRHNMALAHWPALLATRQRLAAAFRLRGEPGDEDLANREFDSARREAGSRGLALPALRGRPSADPLVLTCERQGRAWRLRLGERSVLVAESVGMLHLSVLLTNPRQDILATELVSGLANLTGRTGRPARTAQPVLDAEALREYRSRLRYLDERLDGHSAGTGQATEPEQAGRLQEERDWLARQIADAVGLSGRTRSFPDETERARIAAGKAIRRAVAQISESDAAIGQHLRAAVHTGNYCSYWPR